ncbi:Sensor histidine kinase ComP [Pedobacter sp. Bi27]|uniref:ATP-binding protein n=1 Tax=unclassified Pedobacter TaxID=2628915 RepID=UPI001D4A2843|nr:MULTISPECIES: sensor histidine kinase [unclassified Pedobacter]CAH0160158.1 Sensor histidine kinase ComP [Pedobacter sp. Bi36]CAH0184402.1 Sensor histidine kinase ComP [Pedobacter sp. Bi27]CAH0216014.1 Sensor histidine kinase ComP [Pedobacter sp. Bi126]
MRNYIIFLALLIFYSLNSLAQLQTADQKYTDSLNRILSSGSRDSIKAEAGFKLTDFWVDHDSTKAVIYLNRARTWSKKYPLLVARSYWYEALIYLDRNYTKAEKLLIHTDSLLSKFNTKGVYRLRSTVWHNYALIQQHKDDLKTTLDILINRVLPLSKKAGDKDFLGTEYISIGTVFTNLGQYEKATPYLQQGLNALKDTSPDKYYLLVNAYLTTAGNHYHLKNYSLTKKHLDLAKTILDKSNHVATGYPMAVFWLDYYKSTTRYFIDTKQLSLALVDADRAIKLAEKLNDNYSLQEVIFEKYRILFKQKNIVMAKKTLLQIINQPEINTLATNKLKMTEALAEVNYANGDIKEAYNWINKSKVLSDSLNESKLKADINALEIKYKNAENQKKIASLNTEKKQNALIIKNNKTTNILLIAASFFLLISVILLYFYFRGYKKLAEQRTINYKQKVAELQQKQQLEISKAMLNAEEKERNRVAQDLHDGLGGMLSGLKINLSNWAKHRDMQLHDVELQRIVNQLDNSVTELRHIARNMMPQTLLKFGLETALKDLAESAMSKHMHIDFQALNISKHIALEEQIIIYRVVQEILTNTLKHAQASEVVLQCSENKKRFYITVEDDGIGFDTSTYKKGLGIENIKNRIAYLKGTFEIDSHPGNGTTINIEIPISYE